MIKVWFFIWCD